MLDIMLEAASEWERTHDSAAARRIIADGVRPYVGARAAARLMEGGPGDRGPLAELEPVLALFLGRQAASRLVSHVLDRALVRPY